MKIFITGGAGYLGRAITSELLRARHDVVGLVRRSEQQRWLRGAGAHAIHGELADPDSYRHDAADADAIVHLAAPRGSAAAAITATATAALLEAARAGRCRHFIYTSVLFVLGNVPDGADESTAPAGELYADRAAVEREILEASSSKLTCSVIRPGMVYGGGEGGTISEFIRAASSDDRCIQFVGDGTNRWSLVHREDVAALFRLVLEARGPGVFHATEPEPLTVRQVAQLVAGTVGDDAGCGGADIATAREFLGRFADALALDQPVKSIRADQIGWSPARRFADSIAEVVEEFRRDPRA